MTEQETQNLINMQDLGAKYSAKARIEPLSNVAVAQQEIAAIFYAEARRIMEIDQ